MHELEDEREETTELKDYLRVVKERAWIIILCVVVILAATLYVSYNTTAKYSAFSRLVYQKSNLDQALFGSQVFSSDPTRDVQTAASLVKLDQVAEAVRTQLNSPLSTEQLLRMVSVTFSAATNVVDITAVSGYPSEAKKVADAFAEQFIAFRQAQDRATVASARQLVKTQLDGLSPADASSTYGLMLKEKYESLQILESMQNGGFTLVQNAVVPGSPFSPRPARNGILALVVGLVLGVGLAFLLSYLDKRIKDEKMLERSFGFPVLASVPAVGGRWRAGRKGERSLRPVGFVHHPSLLEPFRALRMSLQYFDVDKNMRTILVTSALPVEGKTTTIVNLGLSLALSGKRVIILEADLRRPMVAEYLGIRAEEGLSTVLAGRTPVASALQLVQLDQFLPPEGRAGDGEIDGMRLQKNLYCLASGPLPPNPAELLGSAHMEKLIGELSGMADYVLIDTPPILVVSDALTLAGHVDGVILTARINATTTDQAQETSSQLHRAGIRVLGVVAGGVKARHGYYHKRGYGYRYAYQTTGAEIEKGRLNQAPPTRAELTSQEPVEEA